MEVNMNLFEIDFYEEDYKRRFYYAPNELFNDDDFSDLMKQADAVIENEKETKQKRAEACVRKFQLLETRYKLAPKLLEQALALCPDMPQALTGMGCFYLRIKDRENAIAYFNKAIGSDPLYPYSWLQKAYIEKDKDEEFRFLCEFIKLNPDSIIGYEKRRRLLDTIENYTDDLLVYKKPKLIKINLQSAIDDYSELIRLVPNNSRYYEKRAELYIKLSKIEFMLSDDDDKFPGVNQNSVKDIEMLMSLTPEHGFYNLIIRINNMLSRLPKETAGKYIEQMISDLSPDTNGYWIAKIIYADRYSTYEKGIEIYTNIINSVKHGSFLQIYSYHNRSQTYFDMKEYEKALSDNEMHIKLCSLWSDKQDYNTREADISNAMADRVRILEEMKDSRELINVYTRILETFKDGSEYQFFVADAYMKRAKIYEENNDIEKALADYSVMIELGANGFEYNVREAYAARIEINKNLGETDKVSADYIKMAELNEDLFGGLLGRCEVEDLIPPKFEIID
jgi:tetratricopeptide (TPR) repeat protein